MAKEHWRHVPALYSGRWDYDFDNKQKVYFVHNNGHRICDSEEREIADAICKSHNDDIV